MDPISFDDEIIHWSGFVFSFWAERGRERILCKVKREAIREFSEFKHASRREIAIEAGHVAELLEPILRKKIRMAHFRPRAARHERSWWLPTQMSGDSAISPQEDRRRLRPIRY